MRLLLGGIPLGCDNIGDEAIIACVVSMLKSSIPGVEITVATADAKTADVLGVNVVPAFGFTNTAIDGFAEVARRHDAYIWCGATGLSDYPHVALDLIEAAQNAGVATYIWGVGMDDELNPAFFKAHGRKLRLLSLFGLVGAYERRLRAKLSRRIARLLPRCKGVWLRDSESAAMLASMGFAGAKVAADTAILLPRPSNVSRPARPTLGLCISTQRRVADMAGVRRLVERVRSSGAEVLGIPMNPKTDRALLDSLGVESISGDTPEAVAEAAAGCSAVLSSRLHLLILASMVDTPIFGIARGSKLANWLKNFGRTVEGSVYDCDWNRVADHVMAALSSRGDWDLVCKTARMRLLGRLEMARIEFVSNLKGEVACGS